MVTMELLELLELVLACVRDESRGRCYCCAYDSDEPGV